jgi:hypothetical protein
MPRRGTRRFFELVKWYISFFNLWAASAALFFLYLLLYDRFRVNVISSYLWASSPSEGAWALLVGTAFSELEPMVAAMHLALIVALLFSLEEGEGMSYVRYAGGAGRLEAYAAKWLASLALFLSPLVGAKLAVILSWDMRASLLLLGWRLAALLVVSLAAYATYLFPILSALAVVVKRPLYYLILVFLELYVIEERWSLLSARYLYMHAALFFLPNTGGVGFFSVERSALLPRLAASLLCAIFTVLWYRLKGEVKWR